MREIVSDNYALQMQMAEDLSGTVISRTASIMASAISPGPGQSQDSQQVDDLKEQLMEEKNER